MSVSLSAAEIAVFVVVAVVVVVLLGAADDAVVVVAVLVCALTDVVGLIEDFGGSTDTVRGATAPRLGESRGGG